MLQSKNGYILVDCMFALTIISSYFLLFNSMIQVKTNLDLKINERVTEINEAL